MAFLVATTSLPAVYRPNDDRWNAVRSRQKYNCYKGTIDASEPKAKLFSDLGGLPKVSAFCLAVWIEILPWI